MIPITAPKIASMLTRGVGIPPLGVVGCVVEGLVGDPPAEYK